MLKKVLFAAVAMGLAATSFGAQAADGCGRAFHRDYYGYCRPDLYRGPPVVVEPAGPSIGVFYAGRGWWDGHRYWDHRYAYHHGWRYR